MTIRRLNEHPEPALMLSIGEAPTTDRGFPRKLDFFRAKAGKDRQWARAAAQFDEVYGVQRDAGGNVTSGPKAVPIYFHRNEIPEVLDVRYVAFGTDRLAARGVTNYAAHPDQMGEPETLIVYPPDRPEPIERKITGPSDPYCMGGQDGIPTDKRGIPTVAVATTLYFGLAEVGAFSGVCSITTHSAKSTGQILEALWRMRTTGTLSLWLMLLAVRPTRVTYWDQKEGKRKRSSAFTWDLIGPVAKREKDGRQLHVPLSRDEMVAEITQAHDRGLLAGLPGVGPARTGALPPAETRELEPGTAADDGEEPEIVDAEVVDP